MEGLEGQSKTVVILVACDGGGKVLRDTKQSI
jgi:hypothetical protein